VSLAAFTICRIRPSLGAERTSAQAGALDPLLLDCNRLYAGERLIRARIHPRRGPPGGLSLINLASTRVQA
jgi:hypothetical protein